MTQPDNKGPADSTVKPTSPDSAQVPSLQDIEGQRDVTDVDAARVKGGVKKTLQTQ